MLDFVGPYVFSRSSRAVLPTPKVNMQLVVCVWPRHQSVLVGQTSRYNVLLKRTEVLILSQKYFSIQFLPGKTHWTRGITRPAAGKSSPHPPWLVLAERTGEQRRILR